MQDLGVLLRPGSTAFNKRFGFAAAFVRVVNPMLFGPSISGFVSGAVIRSAIAVKVPRVIGFNCFGF